MDGKRIIRGILYVGVCILTTTAIAAESTTALTTVKRGFFSYIWGQPVPNSIFYEPIGTHTRASRRQLTWFQLAGGTYHSFFAMTFINSFGNRTWALGMQRYFYQNRIVALGYGFGLMYGYHGQLSTVHGILFKNTFLFKGPINPLLGLLGDVTLTQRVKMSFVVTPLVVTVGLRVILGKI